MEFLDDRFRRALGNKEAEPSRGLEVQPLLPGAREVRQHAGAVAREDGDGLDELAIDLMFGGCTQRAEIVDTAGDQILHRRPASPIRDVGAVYPDGRVEEDAVEVAGRAGASRSHLHLGLVRARIGDEFAQVGGGQILARDQERRLIGDQDHRRKIGGKIVERILVERLVDRIGAAAEHELIAVRRRLGPARRSDSPAPPTFSMITCWARISESRRPTMRPSTSVPPPGANGTTMVSGRAGQLSAAAELPHKSALASAAPMAPLARLAAAASGG